MNPIGHSIEESCHIIFDSIGEGVFTVNLDWCITSFNRAAEKITGIPKHKPLDGCAQKSLVPMCVVKKIVFFAKF